MSISFSILVVMLNPKDKLKNTLNSIKEQKYTNYEVIIKDGGSTDNSLDCLRDYSDLDIKLSVSKDKGIYDAMNQALLRARGEYVYFLNCGDYFASPDVLNELSEALEDYALSHDNAYPDIIYGNIFERLTQTQVCSNPSINGFACYRNVPCHQASIYKREMVCRHPFDISFKVRADYEQFLWCFYKANASLLYIDRTIADYEGGGFSETREQLLVSKKEHRIITKKYMNPINIFIYRAALIITLAPLRTLISKNEKTAAIYNRLKRFLYNSRKAEK